MSKSWRGIQRKSTICNSVSSLLQLFNHQQFPVALNGSSAPLAGGVLSPSLVIFQQLKCLFWFRPTCTSAPQPQPLQHNYFYLHKHQNIKAAQLHLLVLLNIDAARFTRTENPIKYHIWCVFHDDVLQLHLRIHMKICTLLLSVGCLFRTQNWVPRALTNFQLLTISFYVCADGTQVHLRCTIRAPRLWRLGELSLSSSFLSLKWQSSVGRLFSLILLNPSFYCGSHLL